MTTSESKQSVMAHLVKNEPGVVSFLKEGDLIEAALITKTPRAAYFDLGKFGTGIVYGRELINAKTILKSLASHQTVSAKISQLENEDGYIELSLVNAQEQKNWHALRELKDNDEAITVKIKGANSGGLIAEINGVKAFLPVSQLTTDHYPRIEDAQPNKILEELKKFIGEDMQVKILDLNPRSNKLIISEKEASGINLRELLSKYKEGDLVEGIVSGIADFGVFVRFADNPEIEGLVHISELDWKLIESPKEIVKINDTISAKIIEIKDDKVFLSMKALKPNPWDKASELFKKGDEIKGVIHKFTPIGAYVSLTNELYGLIHSSEFGGLEETKKNLEIGKSYEFTIDSISPEEKRISLKINKSE